ncbi:hypothetical protein PTTG_12190 [Puccinia triticina 1-1 BBBD Race 1]|uniref:Autophagy-related protein 14 n=2 Tax=Puccinia triticina TaxID=208348 RepID=A0A180H426_PUCT1|nr:uncharacterized protein PtA15_8A614 [Puccinia triticina]OAV99349.1 hypothetical protein PTTG_12190 [Puccinia triticina 1-1 BBBD Race 1]WAQ87708.1 hypothetical protein PtA15_8A614 [Puccinia triticina]WAR57589.1 hypothetical protein PtB15_8B641 [Puccinia triticina]
MECELCGTSGRKKFFCEVCLNERLLIHKSSLKRLSAAHHATVQKAAQLLEAPGGIQERRVLKSKRAALILNIRSLEAERTRSLEQSESLKASISKKKRELAIRQSRLLAARSQLRYRLSALHQPASEYGGRAFCGPSGQTMDSLPQQIASVHQDWDEVTQELSHLREKLITQLCSIYTITVNHPAQSNSCLEKYNPSGRERDPKSASPAVPTPSSRILGLCLPVSTEIKSYHHEEISAATLYTSHLLRLLAMYLGIKLPFQLIMGPFLSIRAPPNSLWSKKHPSPYPLHIPSSITSMVNSSGSQVSQIAFLSGLCMLAVNAHYLLLTQQPQLVLRSLNSKDRTLPPPSQSQTPMPRPQPLPSGCKPTDLLRNLHSLCLTRPIGQLSHLTGRTFLMRPDDPSIPACIDLQEVIKDVLQSKPEDSVDEGWSII